MPVAKISTTFSFLKLYLSIFCYSRGKQSTSRKHRLKKIGFREPSGEVESVDAVSFFCFLKTRVTRCLDEKQERAFTVPALLSFPFSRVLSALN